MQDKSSVDVYPSRRPKDGLIDWNQPALNVWNLVRAIAPPTLEHSLPGMVVHCGSIE